MQNGICDLQCLIRNHLLFISVSVPCDKIFTIILFFGPKWVWLSKFHSNLEFLKKKADIHTFFFLSAFLY